MFQKRLDTESRNIVQRDLDAFDSKFASGDGVATCTADSDTKQEAGRLSSCAVVEKSDIDRHRQSGEQFSMLQPGDTSDSFRTVAVTPLSGAFAVPTGSFQFQADWKSLKDHPEEFYLYFKVNTILFLFSFNFFCIITLHQGGCVNIGICLFVIWQDYAKITQPIFTKFSGKVAHRPRIKPL